MRGFTLYRVFSRSYFHLTILFVFFYNRGLPVPEVEVILAVYGASLAVAAPIIRPVAARLSLKAAVVTGEVCKAGGLLLLTVPGSIAIAVVAQVVTALGFSLASGTDSALLSEICRRDGEDARSWESRSGSLTFISALIAGVAGALIYLASHILPFLLTAVMSLLAAITIGVAGRGIDTVQRSSAARSASSPNPAAVPSADGEPGAGNNSALLRWSAFYTVVRGVVLALFIGVLPFLLYVRLHASLPVFGLILGSYTLSGYFTARYSKRVIDRFGTPSAAAAAVILTSIGLLILAWQRNIPGAAVATICLGAGVGGVRPMTVGAVNGILAGRPARERAAALRRNEALFATFNTVLILLAGLGLDRIALGSLLVGLTIAYVLIGALVLIVLPRSSGRQVNTVPPASVTKVK